MKILWVKSDFLHPTTRGGQIRTLETLRQLHRQHEIHYVGLDDGRFPEGVARSGEYCFRAYPIPSSVPDKTSPAFAAQLLTGLFSRIPVAVSRYRSRAMQHKIAALLAQEHFDSLVCDFLFPALNLPELSKAVLFQHNVETIIWRRRVEQAPDALRKAYLGLQADRMARFEGEVCRRAGHVIAVSETDAEILRRDFGAGQVSTVATGVDTGYFKPPASAEPIADLVFVGSMDWHANIDAMEFFVAETLTKIRERRPHTTVAIVGRKPTAGILRLASQDARLIVTGTVPDIRPYLWGSRVSIVPLRIGGGTRLKIYEAMAAHLPVVSTSVGFEGLPLTPGQHLEVADTPPDFADRCLRLLADEAYRQRLGSAGYQLVASRFSWESVAEQFERILQNGPRPS
jgi:glycosyltransferase involved in cell wall biosynthesis